MMLWIRVLLGVLLAIRSVWMGTQRLQILDKPWRDVPPRPSVPTLQGVPLVIIIFVLMALLVPETQFWVRWSPFFGFFIGSILIAGISFVDELGRIVHPRFRMSAKIRLWVQTIAAAGAFWVSGVWLTVLDLPGWVVIPLGPLSQIVITIVWFWLFCNAINWLDGVYGLATGMSSIGFMTIALLVGLVVIWSYAGMSIQHMTLLQQIVMVSAICAMVAAVYTMMEYKPRWVVRDVGTMTLWFMLAYIALLGGAKIGTVIVVLALPLFDAVWVIVDRIKRQKNPLKGDFTHLHFRLMALGWNRDEVRVFIWWTSFILMILMLLQGTDRFGKIIIFVMMAVVFFGVNAYLFWYKKLPAVYEPPHMKFSWWSTNDEKHPGDVAA